MLNLFLPICCDLRDITKIYPRKDPLVQTGFAPGVVCCGCNQNKLNYILLSEITLAPMLRTYDLHVATVSKGKQKANMCPSKKNNS